MTIKHLLPLRLAVALWMALALCLTAAGPARDEPTAEGAEDVEFRVALNVGHEDRPLARVASGG